MVKSQKAKQHKLEMLSRVKASQDNEGLKDHSKLSLRSTTGCLRDFKIAMLKL